MAQVQVTVFTPTYNRANTLPRLYKSLREQTCMDFEWIVINDGSTDSTDILFESWLEDDNKFPIHYLKVDNGGKNRAVNKGVEIAKGKYFFIVDSDDFLLPNAISFVLKCFSILPTNGNYIGISTIRGNLDKEPLNGDALIDKRKGYVDCNNLERSQYNLTADMAEVFYTDKLRLYPFPVWENEKFTPEAVVWDRIALDGYKLRWFDTIIYICQYQADGLSASTWSLLRDNPMGYAMLFNIRLEYNRILKDMIYNIVQYISCCCLAKEKRQILKCNRPLLAALLFPIGWMISIRRKRQLKCL